MSTFVDGFVLPLAKDKIDAYRELSTKASAVFREHGALEYRECIGEDLDIPDMLSFKTIAGAGEDETAVFAWISYASREQRDEANAKVMSDPRMNDMCSVESAPFDMKRMAYGGFRVLVSAGLPPESSTSFDPKAVYVDGFVLPIAVDQIDAYREMAEVAAVVWREHGALEYVECVGEDLDIPDMLSFKTISGAKGEEETVVTAWVKYESREHRDAVNAKVMEDQRIKDSCGYPSLPFDFKRMAYGGFKTLVSA